MVAYLHRVLFTFNIHKRKTLRLAAIDIGSNAARLLISDVVETAGHPPEFIKLNLVRDEGYFKVERRLS